VCDPDTAACCFPNCSGLSCGTPDGCGGLCGCAPPLDCVYKTNVCAIVADAFSPQEDFNSVALSTVRGGPVSAVFSAVAEGATMTIDPTECTLVQAAGVGVVIQPTQANGGAAPPQRISFWTVNYMGQNSAKVDIYQVSCMINSLGDAGYESSGPFFLVDPSVTKLGSLLSAVAPAPGRAQCVLTPMQPPGPGNDASAGTYVQITATLADNQVHTLASSSGSLTWLLGNVLPGHSAEVLWLFGGCTSDSDCADPSFPYCQLGNVCGAAPTAVLTQLIEPSSPGSKINCVDVCSQGSVQGATGWGAQGFPASGIFLGGPVTALAQADGTAACQCQAYTSPAAAAYANSIAVAAAAAAAAAATAKPELALGSSADSGHPCHHHNNGKQTSYVSANLFVTVLIVAVIFMGLFFGFLSLFIIEKQKNTRTRLK
jgi:hypothetical protein